MQGGEYLNWIESLPGHLRETLLSHAQKITFQAGQTLYDRTQTTEGIWRIDQGRVRIFLLKDTGSEFLLKICEEGETVGDLAAIDGLPFPVYAEAKTFVSTSFIPIKPLQALRKKHVEIDTALLLQMVSSSRGIISLLEQVTMHSIEKQVAGRLQWLLRSEHLRGYAGQVIKLSQQDLALMLGASRQTVNKALAKLEHKGLIRRQYGEIIVQNAAGLDNYLALTQR